MATTDSNELPIFKAVSSSARQLTQLLNCIRFASKAQVRILSEGIRFSVDEARVMQGVAFLDKKLFTSFTYNITPLCEHDESNTTNRAEAPTFQISLIALLETLQILGFSETTNRFQKPGTGESSDYNSNIRPYRTDAFSSSTLGMPITCRLSYQSDGSPFSIVLEEAGVVTTCNLNTYESADEPEEIPFNRTEIDCKIIMQSRYLYDALMELSHLNPSSSTTSSTRLTVYASPDAPYLTLSMTGPYGSSHIEFSKSRELLETFQVSRRWTQSYKFEHVRVVAEALKLGSKVSFRGDSQGVLSLQVLVEGEGGIISFVDFKFVPFAGDDGGESGEELEEEEDEDNEFRTGD